MSDEIQVDLIQLDGKLQRMMDGIETVKDRQEHMASDILKIKEAVYNPDEGLYARLRELESWKANQSRLMWIVITAVVGLSTAAVFTAMSCASDGRMFGFLRFAMSLMIGIQCVVNHPHFCGSRFSESCHVLSEYRVICSAPVILFIFVLGCLSRYPSY